MFRLEVFDFRDKKMVELDDEDEILLRLKARLYPAGYKRTARVTNLETNEVIFEVQGRGKERAPIVTVGKDLKAQA